MSFYACKYLLSLPVNMLFVFYQDRELENYFLPALALKSGHVTLYGQRHKRKSGGITSSTKQTIFSRYLWADGLWKKWDVTAMQRGQCPPKMMVILSSLTSRSPRVYSVQTSGWKAEGVQWCNNNGWQPLLSLLAVHYFKRNTNDNSFQPQHRTKRQVLSYPFTDDQSQAQ